jgi:uncharacterized protein YcfJ
MRACSTHHKVKIMKHPLLLLAALAASFSSMAQDVGRVISSTPVLEQVGVPHNVCSVEQVAVQQRKSGAGAIMGAIAGGAMGNAIGQGGGRTVATMVGLMGGAILGDHIEGAPATQYQNVQRCTTQITYENRIVAYNVVYDYAGRRYQVQMANDPGRTIPLNISPVGTSVTVQPSAYTTVYDAAPGYVAPVLVVPPARHPYPIILARDDRREHRIEHRWDRRDDWQDNHRD